MQTYRGALGAKTPTLPQLNRRRENAFILYVAWFVIHLRGDNRGPCSSPGYWDEWMNVWYHVCRTDLDISGISLAKGNRVIHDSQATYQSIIGWQKFWRTDIIHSESGQKKLCAHDFSFLLPLLPTSIWHLPSSLIISHHLHSHTPSKTLFPHPQWLSWSWCSAK